MAGRKGNERTCGVENCIAYCDAVGEVTCFEEPVRYYGRLSEEPSSVVAESSLVEGQSRRESLDLFRIFVPCDEEATRQVPLAEWTEAELERYRTERRSACRSFLEWLSAAKLPPSKPPA